MTVATPAGEFRNTPPSDFSRPETREAFKRGLEQARALFPMDVPLLINGKRIETAEKISSLDPAHHSRVLAQASSATEEHVNKAVKAARAAYGDWARTPAEQRAGVLLRAARLIEERKYLLTGVIVHESGKPWREADADVDEAIDFLEFYAREMARLGRPRRLQNYLLGEHNDLSYHPLGIVAVIGPWNFPLAIPVGMASAALVAGNTVLLKPAEQTPLIAYLWVRIMEEAGLPPGVLNFLPGRGEVCGARMVSHPDVNMVVFTGSREVGLHIIREASAVPEGQHFVKRVVTEMGGKNAIIVDSSADLDSSVPDTIYSAFGFAGQKCSACSRLILVAEIYEDYLKRLKEGVESLKIGLPEHPATQVGPVIDEEAAAKVQRYIEIGQKTARTIHISELGTLRETGYFVPPSVFAVDSPTHRLAQDEIFGPVLSVIKARDFDEALDIANSTAYALTGGVHSRTPSNLRRAREEYHAGNLYLNRTITGAIVGRQPFGGYRLSGIGSKAGGPDYLKQFLVARVVSENMMRHGMASLVEAPAETWED
jgi:RHH-type proline utilization regulon transcriptional repressor/proline dehydrogenase/delta 1-pyrroline-5-carboxylate dehydrogenase